MTIKNAIIAYLGVYVLYKISQGQQDTKPAVPALGAIYDPNKEYLYTCTDGVFSDVQNGCKTHGGMAEDQQTAIPLAKSDVSLIPLKLIYTDPKAFQNRQTEFSSDSVDRIVNATKQNKFVWANFDPITLWKSPEDGKLYVLSGHSRFEAFKQLQELGAKVDGRKFDKIPAKIFIGSKQQAIEIALNSNILSTKETDSERVNYYRRLLGAGLSLKEVHQKIKDAEGKNWKQIIAYMHLNPQGATFNALKLLEGGQVETSENIKNIAYWIGSARMKFPELSNLHENEMFEFLKSGKSGISNLDDFIRKMHQIIQQRQYFGKLDPEQPLNIFNLSIKSSTEKDHETQVQEAKRTVNQLIKQRDDLQKRARKEGYTATQILKYTDTLDQKIKFAQLKLQELLISKTKVQEAAKDQTNLFAVSGIHTINGTTFF